uniref:Uncharacterized protein n=1 Tax=Rhizophora mucronata TaxID=61149 RepID=A0A2P2PCD1_RHIMU
MNFLAIQEKKKRSRSRPNLAFLLFKRKIQIKTQN